MVYVESAMGIKPPTFRLHGFRARRRTALGVSAALLALGAPGPAASAAPVSAQIASVPGKPVVGRLFAPNSVWNQPIPAKARIDRASRRLVANLASQAEYELAHGYGPFVQTYTYTTPVYVVGPHQHTAKVAIDTDQKTLWVTSLQGASNRVPIPRRAEASAGTTSQTTIYQPSTNRLWEYWHFHHEPDGWHARWGGAIDDVSDSPGYYTTSAWNGALSVWGASATSLPLVAGTMTLAELRAGHIDHALAITIPHARAGVVAWPAQRTDGTGGSIELPEGAHLRLNPRLNIPAMHLPKIVEMIALAAQRYGIIVRDQSFADIGFFAEDPTQYRAKPYTASDPYYGQRIDADGSPDRTNGRPNPNALFDGMWPSEFFRYFPWRSLQVLKMSLRHFA
jgi:hypothetical protein